MLQAAFCVENVRAVMVVDVQRWRNLNAGLSCMSGSQAIALRTRRTSCSISGSETCALHRYPIM